MRLLHTSDWHLGRTLHGLDLLDHQATALDQIVEIAEAESADAVLVSGDVFDRAIPPVEAVRLLEQTLRRLTEHATVIVTSGNHDSAARLGYGSSLFPDRLHVVTRAERTGHPIELEDQHGPVIVYPFPYLDPDGCRHTLATGDEPLARSHEAVCTAAMRRVWEDIDAREARGMRTVVMAHAFVVGGIPPDTSESERDIRVGGVDSVPSAVFDGASYVALGHLHGPQEPKAQDGATRLRYSGSPLRFSFSEAEQEKSVTVVELDASGVAEIRPIPIAQPRPMARITGTLDEILTDPDFAAHEEAWAQVTITDAARPPQMRERVAHRFPHLLEIRHAPPASTIGTSTGVANPRKTDPLHVMRDFVEHVTGQPATDTELTCLQTSHDAVLVGERED
ncbi:exonuclease SbcCD subunit D [Actinobacteria bacterium YIM 96077]|uniref:Nuclease SbcCD subunit D n=1 Tax=Phytoactinopolyspora halophila TaxID=1981511 RepID=A0A329QQL1_9ACTN|nr:exonuclease SbcCD subunit D [Phytoactinopolyspora halophila]AYY15023.1 exonuclease SbcCD subunit D [Actinobacteria bacterium YIM 96077]RAW14211.1 exonuclease sbcCD subunit D [Phytoactinopolyspora halophila]